MPENALKGHRCRSSARPLAFNVVLAVAKAATGATHAQLEEALDAGTGAGWAAVSRVRYLRTVDPDLARRIHEIEAELGAP